MTQNINIENVTVENLTIVYQCNSAEQVPQENEGSVNAAEIHEQTTEPEPYIIYEKDLMTPVEAEYKEFRSGMKRLSIWFEKYPTEEDELRMIKTVQEACRVSREAKDLPKRSGSKAKASKSSSTPKQPVVEELNLFPEEFFPSLYKAS